MKHFSVYKKACKDTLPVMTGYLVLGIGFGMILKANGCGFLWSLLMSTSIYAGSLQYVAIDLLKSGAGLITVALTTLMVNARHLFYGISMIDKYRNLGKMKPYVIFALTDETYSLVCIKDVTEENSDVYFLTVSLLDHLYWIVGSLLGSLLGTVIRINTAGMDFALTALFLTVFVEQWKEHRHHAPALIGVLSAIVCLFLFGKEEFLLPAMLLIALLLTVFRKFLEKNEG